MKDIYQFLSAEGVVVANTSSIRDQVVARFKDRFGQDLNTDSETLIGTFIDAMTLSLKNTAESNAAMANMMNPNISFGTHLRAIGSLLSIEDEAATHSIIKDVEFRGKYQTVIPERSIVATEDNVQFETASRLVIDQDGLIKGDVVAIESGPISCQIGDLKVIKTPVLGWETVENKSEAQLGRGKLSDAGYRNKYYNQLAINTLSTNEANISGLHNIPEVKSLSYLENYTKQDKTIAGIPMLANSIWCCIDGGTDQQIALSLLRTKTMGATYNGSQEVTITDPASEEPYTVKFDRPIDVNIFVKVDINQSKANAPQIIKNAILEMANGNIEGAAGFKVGTNIYPFEMSYAINSRDNSITVLNIQVSRDGKNWTSGELEIAINEIARIQDGSIEVKERAIRY